MAIATKGGKKINQVSVTFQVFKVFLQLRLVAHRMNRALYLKTLKFCSRKTFKTVPPSIKYVRVPVTIKLVKVTTLKTTKTAPQIKIGNNMFSLQCYIISKQRKNRQKKRKKYRKTQVQQVHRNSWRESSDKVLLDFIRTILQMEL